MLTTAHFPHYVLPWLELACLMKLKSGESLYPVQRSCLWQKFPLTKCTFESNSSWNL